MFEVSEALTSVEELVIGIKNSRDSEKIKDSAQEAFEFLQDVFDKLQKLKGKFETDTKQEYIPSSIKVKEIKMIGDEDNYINNYKNLETIEDCVGIAGFVAIQYGKQALLINKDHIVSIEPVSLERW